MSVAPPTCPPPSHSTLHEPPAKKARREADGAAEAVAGKSEAAGEPAAPALPSPAEEGRAGPRGRGAGGGGESDGLGFARGGLQPTPRRLGGVLIFFLVHWLPFFSSWSEIWYITLNE